MCLSLVGFCWDSRTTGRSIWLWWTWFYSVRVFLDTTRLMRPRVPWHSPSGTHCRYGNGAGIKTLKVAQIFSLASKMLAKFKLYWLFLVFFPLSFLLCAEHSGWHFIFWGREAGSVPAGLQASLLPAGGRVAAQIPLSLPGGIRLLVFWWQRAVSNLQVRRLRDGSFPTSLSLGQVQNNLLNQSSVKTNKLHNGGNKLLLLQLRAAN